MTTLTAALPRRAPWGWVMLVVILWIAAYANLTPFADAVLALTALSPKMHLGEALHFFFYDTPKVLLLLTAIVFVMGIVHTFISPERTRAFLSGRRLGVGNVLAATLGIVTPFCSCSAVPLFIGFVTAGIPLGVTFSFLIAAPMVNEVALILLYGMLGWKVAALYLGTGLVIAITAGWIIGRCGLEDSVEDWVREMQTSIVAAPEVKLDWYERMSFAGQEVRDIVGRVWPYVVAGIAIGAGIHGFVPQDFMAGIMGREAWWSVPLAVIIGVPMYSNAAGIVPVVQVLLEKGAALGTVLAFMMSVIALSLPEVVILRRVLKPKLIGVFVGVVAIGIMLVGFLFNAVL